MSVKLLLTYDIQAGREQEYFEFVIREFIPGIQRLGLEPSDAWYTVFGNYPQILVAAKMPNLKELQTTLKSGEWQSLIDSLMDFVHNFQIKVVEARGGFQL